MIVKIIDWSINNRFLVLMLTVILIAWGIFSIKQTPLDAIPDLSDVQVIIKTPYPGQAPRVVEDQVTYPLTTAMLSVPGAVKVRGYSFFGDSYIYVIFKDGTDKDLARARVDQYLNQVKPRLPADAKPALGPDATGVGWIYQYALVDRTGKHDLSQLRAKQDWFIKYILQTVPGVAEVSTVGGMVKQYQVVVQPDKIRALGITLRKIRMAIKNANKEVGGSVIEMGEAEYMIRATGYIQNTGDLKNIPLGVNKKGIPILLKDVAEIRVGPQMRRGIAELNGEGEVVGGIIVMQSGENAREIIRQVKKKIEEVVKPSLPKGVELIEVYDRSALIDRSVATLVEKLIEEFIIVALVCIVFLFHMRSALVAIISLPIGIITAFIIMHSQGINANIMSLGGIAIAIGAMVDAAIVMIENVHKHLEKEGAAVKDRWQVIRLATHEVGAPLFFSLMIITLSFIPVFTLEAQEGKLFSPLAFTKTYAMAAAAGLSITLVPVLMGYFIKGHITPEHKNPVNRFLIKVYKPFIYFALRKPEVIVVTSLLVMVSMILPYSQIGEEFMPDIDEGDLMYMPTTFPGISIGKAQEILQQTDKLIKTVPEVKTVFGKIGRADSPTDPAPLTMIETTIQFKPRDQWRPGMTPKKIRDELKRIVKLPGLSNAWVMPIKTRIDMLATGVKTPVGIRISGPDLKIIQEIGEEIEREIMKVPGTLSAYSQRVASGRYVTVDINRQKASRYGLNIADVQEIIRTAIGGMQVSESVEGRQRFPINIRYPRYQRDSLEKLKKLPIVTPTGAQIILTDVADVKVEIGPAAITSEGARPNGWVLVDIKDRDLGSYVREAREVIEKTIRKRKDPETGEAYSIDWSGQYEYMVRAAEREKVIYPLTLIIIVLLLYLNFRNFTEVMVIIGTLPLALVGGIWLLYALDYNMSVAVKVGFIALAGVTVEIGVIMLTYLNQAYKRKHQKSGKQHTLTIEELREAIIEGALLRIRPIMMTVSAIIAGLLPIMLGTGTGSEVMRRIAAPMVGGMVSATVLTLVLLPAVFLIIKRREVKRSG